MNKKDILKAYLGKFLRKPSEFIREKIRELKTEDNNLIITNTADINIFNEIITQLLLQEGRKRYEVISSRQVIETCFCDDIEIKSLREYDSPVLIVIITLKEVANKSRWEIIYQLALERILLNLGMTIITQYISQNDLNSFKGLNYKILNFSNSSHKSNVF